jgi:hypothetical protein
VAPACRYPQQSTAFIGPSLNLNGLMAFTTEFSRQREAIMPQSLKLNRLPERFPVGTTYVVEGQRGEHGQLLVSSRYVVMPGGQHIEIATDCGKSASLCSRQRSRRDRVSQTSRSAGRRVGRSSVLR